MYFLKEDFGVTFYFYYIMGIYVQLINCFNISAARNDVRHLVLSLLWAGLCIGITHFVRANGRVFTNRPRFYQSRH